MATAADGKRYKPLLNNLDIILAIGYRVYFKDALKTIIEEPNEKWTKFEQLYLNNE